MTGISIVIVTFNNEDTIEDCLNSILECSSQSPVIVVDNNSQDGTVKKIKKYGTKVLLIESGTNLGFSKGSNLGAKQVKTDFIAFLNPDTKLITINSLSKLKIVLESDKTVGVVGPKIKHPNGSIQKTVRNLPTVPNAFREYILGIKGSYDFYQPVSLRLCEVESIVGACMVMHKGIFDSISGFDEKYFLYFEDIELCRSIRSLGLKVVYNPEVVITHILGASGSGQKTSAFLEASAKKYHGLIDYYFIQAIIRMSNIYH